MTFTGSVLCDALKKTRAVYPGSFDPVTNGHIDLIQRSAALFDRVIVSILRNTEKIPLFTIEERVEMLENVIRDHKLENVSVCSFGGLLVDFVEQTGASVIIRGIRAISDYEYFSFPIPNKQYKALYTCRCQDKQWDSAARLPWLFDNILRPPGDIPYPGHRIPFLQDASDHQGISLPSASSNHRIKSEHASSSRRAK